MVKAIYGDKTELLKRESMGVITEDMMSVFREKFVNALFDRPRYKLRKLPLFVFVACDPNGGGDSEMGLVSLVVEYNSIIIVGMDTFCCKGADAINKLLTAHIERLRAKTELKDAWFIFIPEANVSIFLCSLSQKPTNNVPSSATRRTIWNICFATTARYGPFATSQEPVL